MLLYSDFLHEILREVWIAVIFAEDPFSLDFTEKAE